MIIPEMIGLRDWAHSLIVDFPNDDIPILSDEKDWKRWGNLVIDEPSFSENGAPTTERYGEWREWARAIFLAMANT